jgi:hypothetical protein
MKPHAEMNEGPQALARFENTMKALFSKRKVNVPPKKSSSTKQPKASAKPKLQS